MIVNRPGYYLADHPPARSQTGHRRNGHKPTLILTHTAESGTDLTGADLSAEGTARFIARRTTPGSYHRVGDRDSIIPMASTKWATWGSRFVNDWAVHISLAMDAADWPSLPGELIDDFLVTWLDMATTEATEIHRLTGTTPPPVLLNGAEARRPGARGFSTHGRVDPGRREDPGRHFPWVAALTEYAVAMGFRPHDVEIHPDPKDNHGGPTVPTAPISNPLVAEQQQDLTEAGYDPGPADGIYGPRTRAADREALADARAGRTTADELDYLSRRADGFGLVVEAQKAINREIEATS